MKEQVRAVIFDFDYTLADPARGTEACINFALKELGLPPAPAEAIGRINSLSLVEGFRHLVGPEHLEQCDTYVQLFVQRADEVMAGATALFETVSPAIKGLKARGVALGIVSLKYKEHILPVLAREGLLAAFEVVVGGREVTRPKPDPEGVHLAMARLGSTAADTLYVGDSVTDAETARRAGVPFVAVLSGTARREAFEAYQVYQVLAHLGELPERLGY